MSFSSPPMFPTEYTPKEIVGDANLKEFRKHYGICSSGTNNGEFPEKRLDKEVGPTTRQAIAETYRHLRENGFYPVGMTPDGKIKVSVQVKSECQIIMEKGLKMLGGKSMKELQQMARSGWNPLIDRVKVEKLTDVEEAYQPF